MQRVNVAELHAQEHPWGPHEQQMLLVINRQHQLGFQGYMIVK